MGKRGPPPLPTAIKKARGTHQKCRDAPNAVEAPVGAPPRPSGLEGDKVAAAKWDEVLPKLLELKVVSELDGQALESYCRAYSRWVAYQALAEAEPIVETVFGPKVNPSAGEARKWAAILNACGDRLGLSPSARTRVSSAGGKPKDDAKAKARAFLFRGGLQAIPGGKG